VDSARKETYRQTDSLDAPAREADDGRAIGETIGDEATAGPERSAHNARLRPMLQKAIAALPEEQREVFLLREYHGVSFKEIADVTGVNENTVKSRMRYALEGLRKKLAELGVDGELVTEGRTVA
jgi:RNA polymerase sigma-70 factor (ECF subfamily)